MEIELALLSIRQSCSDSAAAHMNAVADSDRLGIPVIRKSEIRVRKVLVAVELLKLIGIIATKLD